MMQDAEVMLHLGGVKTRSDAWRLHMIMIGSWVALGFAMFSVFEKSSGKWVGRIGPWQPEGWPGTEVGWNICREFWGKGYAVEAASASMDYAFDVLGWDEVIHSIDEANVNSIKLAQRLGSTKLRKGILPLMNGPKEIDLWGQSAAQWRARGLPNGAN